MESFHSTQMMSTNQNIYIILILSAVNASICRDIIKDNLEMMVDGNDKHLEKKNWHEKETHRLANALNKSWKELNKKLACSKLPFCAISYSKKYRVGRMNMRLNLVQSLTLSLQQIKDISAKLNAIKRYLRIRFFQEK